MVAITELVTTESTNVNESDELKPSKIPHCMAAQSKNQLPKKMSIRVLLFNTLFFTIQSFLQPDYGLFAAHKQHNYRLAHFRECVNIVPYHPANLSMALFPLHQQISS